MILRFEERFALPAEEVFSYFRTPAGWVRLYGLAGTVVDQGDGWYAIPLKSFPFPLVAKVTTLIPNRFVRWEFRGFWKGWGEITFTADEGETMLSGTEEISVRWLFGLSPLVERLFLQHRFLAIWALGWRRLRKRQNTTE